MDEMLRLNGKYRKRGPLFFILVFLYSLYIFWDWLTDNGEAWLLVPIFVLAVISVALAIFYSGTRQVSIRNSAFYIKGYKQQWNRIKSYRLIDPNHLEVKFNLLWILRLEGTEQEIAVFERQMSQLINSRKEKV